MHYGSLITNPCAKFDYGEVEDYTVNLSGGSGFTEFAGADNFKADNIASTTISVNLNPVQVLMQQLLIMLLKQEE